MVLDFSEKSSNECEKFSTNFWLGYRYVFFKFAAKKQFIKDLALAVSFMWINGQVKITKGKPKIFWKLQAQALESY